MTAKRPRRTAERILDATLALFNRFGEPNVSTSQLCAEMGISPGNLFYHHPTRDALIAGLFARYGAELDTAMAEALSAQAVTRWPAASPALNRLEILCDALAHTAWAYRFLFRDLSDLVSRQRVLEEAMPALLGRQAEALERALRALQWSPDSTPVNDTVIRLWAGHMLASLTGSTGLDGALDPREHRRDTEVQAVERATSRAVGLVQPCLASPDREVLGAHLALPEQLGSDPWGLSAQAWSRP
ncbi:MAG: TetR/AcrR family transcriptional regulator [Rubrivivax sp.]|nr:MAG: TetR/AcrR family transcriptional regulator [Rubrivivax sp.]